MGNEIELGGSLYQPPFQSGCYPCSTARLCVAAYVEAAFRRTALETSRPFPHQEQAVEVARRTEDRRRDDVYDLAGRCSGVVTGWLGRWSCGARQPLVEGTGRGEGVRAAVHLLLRTPKP